MTTRIDLSHFTTITIHHLNFSLYCFDLFEFSDLAAMTLDLSNTITMTFFTFQYSLEGHQFAVFGFRLTQDLRYIVSVSNKFITWDLSTSDLTREVIPGIEGIMQDLVLSPDNKYSIAHTNNSQVQSYSIVLWPMSPNVLFFFQFFFFHCLSVCLCVCPSVCLSSIKQCVS